MNILIFCFIFLIKIYFVNSGIFTSSQTTVANGSNDAIWAGISATNITRNCEGGFDCHFSSDEAIKIGLTKILPGHALEFYPKETFFSSEVYVTIFYQKGVREECPGNLILIASLLIKNDNKLVVDAENVVHYANFNNVWIDRLNYKNYKRDPWPEKSDFSSPEELQHRCKEIENESVSALSMKAFYQTCKEIFKWGIIILIVSCCFCGCILGGGD